MLVSLPFVLLVLDVYPLRRLAGQGWRSATARALIVEKLPYLGLAVAAIVWTSAAMSTSVRVTPLALYPPVARVAMAAYSLAFYPWKTLAPLDLIPMYELPLRVSLLRAPFLTAILAVLVVTVVLVLARRRWPGGLAVGFAYALALAPVSGLIHAGPQLVADRFSYLPSLGLCLLPGAGVAVALAKPALGRAVVAGAAVWIMALAMLTWSQVQVWSDTDTLFAYTLQIAPDCAWCQHQYGGRSVIVGARADHRAGLRARRPLLPDRVVYHHHSSVWRCSRPGVRVRRCRTWSGPSRRSPGTWTPRCSSGSRWWRSIDRPRPCRISSARQRHGRRRRMPGSVSREPIARWAGSRRRGTALLSVDSIRPWRRASTARDVGPGEEASHGASHAAASRFAPRRRKRPASRSDAGQSP